MTEREEILKKIKELGLEEKGFRVLSPEEHIELVRGKKIVLSEELKEELHKTTKE